MYEQLELLVCGRLRNMYVLTAKSTTVTLPLKLAVIHLS